MFEIRSLMLKMRDGTDIYCTDYFPANPAHSSIVFMHGLGEHSGRYDHLADFFVRAATQCAPMIIAVTANHRASAVTSPIKTAYSMMHNRSFKAGRPPAHPR